ncbi:2612_t:CDS:2 [Diversispora eburnea]|uniref:2612_t:CDS:1 n=1 Tax=Diversispora eburnea TaxID=1213867 RepID=A0A9N9F8Y1_9GLOM|nr:2612_t:CDS:2 [Diversispora eburnea]
MSIVTVFVQSDSASSERRFDKGLTIQQLKTKLEPITGVPANSQSLQLYNGDTLVATLEGDDYMLGAFPVDNFMILRVIDTNPNSLKNQYTDVSLVEKYVMPDEDYSKRKDSVLAFKQRNKFGRFGDANSSYSESTYTYEDEAKDIKVGDRCEVDFSEGSEEGLKRRGVVKYVGETKFKPGYWIGVQYDEPVGKHDGSVQGERYFTCSDKT